LTDERRTVSKILFALAVLMTLTVILFWLYEGQVWASGSGLSIVNVSINRSTLNPGEEVMIFYRLTEDAKVSIYIYDPDYAVVRKLLDGIKRPAGTNTMVWDGRDDSGEMAPDEAYVFSIAAEGNKGEKALYDPMAHSGGEILDKGIDKVERSAGDYVMHYSVGAPSRISIRAGVHKGPMLKTILDWKPLPPGEYTETWDGMDETGQIRVMEEPGSILYLRGFLLPENTIIVQGNGRNYHVYQSRHRAESAEDRKIISHETVKRAALQRTRKGLHPEFLVRRALNVAPKFTVYPSGNRLMGQRGKADANISGTVGLADNPGMIVSGKVGLTIEVEPESVQSFNELRYEIVVFVDNQRFDEEEQAYTPYTYVLDTTKLTDGEHWVTINQASLTGQVGTYSFLINVNNKNL